MQKWNQYTSIGMWLLIAVQLVCASFFLVDVLKDHSEDRYTGSIAVHMFIETIALLSLLAAIAVEMAAIRRNEFKKFKIDKKIQRLKSEVEGLILEQFKEWNLSQAETEIALFIAKGFNTQQIANLRGTTEGTTKVQINSILRKAGMRSRNELLSTLIDGLLGARLTD